MLVKKFNKKGLGFNVAPYYKASGGVLNPLTLPSLLVWTKSDVGLFQDTGGTTPATTGTDVLRWNDQSGNGNNLVSVSSTGAPTSLTTTTLNGRPTVSSLGNTKPPLQCALTLGVNNKFSCFGVFRSTNSGPRNFGRFFSGMSVGDGTDFNTLTGFQVAEDNGSGSPIPLAAGSNSLSSSGSLVVSTWTQIGITFDGSTMRFYVGGVLTGTPISVADAFVNPFTFSVCGNGQGGGGSNGMLGGSTEVLAGNADWTANVSDISAYLLNGWGV
jgi:hypothetical protein